MALVLLLDVEDNDFYVRECNKLQDYYKFLKTDTFDIVRRKVGKKVFDVYIDDIGLFREAPRPSMVNETGKTMLVGNLIFANHDAEGNTTSLTDDDIREIFAHTLRDGRYVVICNQEVF